MLAEAEVLVDHLRLHGGPAVPQLDHGRGVVSGHLGRLRNSPWWREVTLLLDRRFRCCTRTGRACGCACDRGTTSRAYSHRGFLFVFGCKQCLQDGEQAANMAVAILIFSKFNF